MAVDESCSTKQTFCELSKQTVKQNDNIKFTYAGCITASEIIDNSTWNELIQAIVKVHNYGKRGTRNPNKPFSLTPDTEVDDTTVGHETDPTKKISTTKYKTKYQNDSDSIDWNDYTEILNTIGATIPTDKKIYGSYFSDIATKLNNYKLDDTRCDNCNTGCNVSCQARAQCCDSHCCTQCCTECCTNCCTNASSETWWCGSNNCGNNGCYRTQ